MYKNNILKTYIIPTILLVLMAGCTGKDTIPPKPPKSEESKVDEARTVEEMESKLEHIRNPIAGEDVSDQKREAKEEIDTLLSDAKEYKNKVSRFEKAQLLALKKAKKSHRYKHKKQGKKLSKKPTEKKETIDMVNEYENKLKYY